MSRDARIRELESKVERLSRAVTRVSRPHLSRPPRRRFPRLRLRLLRRPSSTKTTRCTESSSPDTSKRNSKITKTLKISSVLAEHRSTRIDS